MAANLIKLDPKTLNVGIIGYTGTFFSAWFIFFRIFETNANVIALKVQQEKFLLRKFSKTTFSNQLC
jgi:hypothetical protein